MLVLSLCDFSGNWPAPFKRYGYEILTVDIKRGDDVRDFDRVIRSVAGREVDVLLMAPPCTHFTVSGAQYWPAKDADGRTAEMLNLVDACLRIRDAVRPRVWALENPIGRLPKLRPETLGRYALKFNPCDYALWADDPQADAYTKATCLWGEFKAPLKCPVQPVRVCSQGSWVQRLGGSSDRTKELRSMTPQGFARAFAHANAKRLP